MPTASEYKHEPVGLPCNCYVRRRINNTFYQKSCLRKSREDQSARKYREKSPKSVTFDPILQICFYKSSSKCKNYQKVLLNTSEQENLLPKPAYQSPAELQKTDIKSRHPDESGTVKDAEPKRIRESSRPLLVNGSDSPYNWSLCDKITSFFGFHKVNSLDIVSREAKTSSADGGAALISDIDCCDQPFVDENNNNNNDDDVEDNSGPEPDATSNMDCTRDHRRMYGNQICLAGAACKYANRPRGRTSPLRRSCGCDKCCSPAVIREPVLAAMCNSKSRSSSSSWEYGNFGASRQHVPPSLVDTSSSGSSYQQQHQQQPQLSSRSGSNVAAVSPYQVSSSQHLRAASGSPTMLDCNSTCPPAYELNATPQMSTFHSPSTKDGGSSSSATGATTAASIVARSGTIGGGDDEDDDDRMTEKSDEYIYAAPDNKNHDYEYVPVKSTLRRRTESENLDCCPGMPATFDDGNRYGYSFAKHKTESDLTVDKCPDRAIGHQRLDTVTPQSAPDLQTIMSSPYDIKFLNECVKAYVRSTGDDELEIDILAKMQTVEKTETSPLNRKSDAAKRSIIDDILWMTPVALFWTGCAFLVGLIYIILFSCTKDQE